MAHVIYIDKDGAPVPVDATDQAALDAADANPNLRDATPEEATAWYPPEPTAAAPAQPQAGEPGYDPGPGAAEYGGEPGQPATPPPPALWRPALTAPRTIPASETPATIFCAGP